MRRVWTGVHDCQALSDAADELRRLEKEFDADDPEDVRSRIQVFASCLKRSGILRERDSAAKNTAVFSEIIEQLHLEGFESHLAGIELFELYISEYADPDGDSMNTGLELLKSFGPKLVQKLDNMKQECSQANPKSQP